MAGAECSRAAARIQGGARAVYPVVRERVTGIAPVKDTATARGRRDPKR